MPFPAMVTLVTRSSAAEFTTMVNDFASLRTGDPLSVTRTVIRFVLGAWVVEGVQVNTPVVGLMLAPDGAPGSRLNASVLTGKSESVAEALTVSCVPGVAL